MSNFSTGGNRKPSGHSLFSPLNGEQASCLSGIERGADDGCGARQDGITPVEDIGRRRQDKLVRGHAHALEALTICHDYIGVCYAGAIKDNGLGAKLVLAALTLHHGSSGAIADYGSAL